jgi:hypothetical protein
MMITDKKVYRLVHCAAISMPLVSPGNMDKITDYDEMIAQGPGGVKVVDTFPTQCYPFVSDIAGRPVVVGRPGAKVGGLYMAANVPAIETESLKPLHLPALRQADAARHPMGRDISVGGGNAAISCR